MKINALRRLRQRLQADEPVLGLWITLESPSIAEMAVTLGLDWIVVDAEHGHLDWKEIVEHVRAAVRSDTVVLVRVAENNAALIKRALDIGADGVVVPWISTAAQLEAAIAAATYPPAGIRGIGAERATCWGQCFTEHTREADDNVLVIPIIESVEAVKNIQDLLRVPRTDVFFFGPADLSSTAGSPGAWEGPGVAELIAAAREAVRARGRHCGVVATSDANLAERRAEGFRMLALGLDAGMLLRSLHASLQAQGRDRAIRASFSLENDPVSLAGETPVACAPPTMRPDRGEVIVQCGEGTPLSLARGVDFECLVGTPIHAKNLTTGIATFAPAATLPYHRHSCAESITVLSGRATVEVEGWSYNLGPLDNATVPASLAHRVRNISRSEPAVFHVAMSSDSPDRDWVDRFFPGRTMPAKTGTYPKGERLTFTRDATPYHPGTHASFIDYFNAQLLPGLAMSGGYGVFQPGGRLPAHLHDFDESICIVEGRATCVVEGRRYSLTDRATALQPRGRIHYFINESTGPMAMIWVYAGPLPERLVVDERCAANEGVAWPR